MSTLMFPMCQLCGGRHHPGSCCDTDSVRQKSGSQPIPDPSAADLISRECDGLKAMLLKKNAQYGNSALEPLRVFSKADPVEQIRVRLDDKLSRLARGQGVETEDVVQDLLGYLILLRVAQRMQADSSLLGKSK